MLPLTGQQGGLYSRYHAVMLLLVKTHRRSEPKPSGAMFAHQLRIRDMPWIESHADLGEHPKLYALADALGIETPTAVGHLKYLWWHAIKYALDGNLSSIGQKGIARVAKWNGDPSAFVSAMVSSGFLNADLTIHDWMDYAGRYLDLKESNRKKQQAFRDRKAKEVTGYVTPVVTGLRNPGSNHATVPNHTLPDQGNKKGGEVEVVPPMIPPMTLKELKADARVVAKGIPDSVIERFYDRHDSMNWVYKGDIIRNPVGLLIGYADTVRQSESKLNGHQHQSSGAADMIRNQTELKRVEDRMKQLKEQAGQDAFGSVMWSDKQRDEHKKLKARAEELKKALGFTV